MTKHTLPDCVQTALKAYFENLGDQKPSNIYTMVMSEAEKAVFKAVLHYAQNKQSMAAQYLGISRGTLRKKLREYDLYNDI
jgi:Fis family transcriptional regulator